MQTPGGDGPWDMGYTLFSALVAAGVMQVSIGQSTSPPLEIVHKAFDDLKDIEGVLWAAMELEGKASNVRWEAREAAEARSLLAKKAEEILYPTQPPKEKRGWWQWLFSKPFFHRG